MPALVEVAAVVTVSVVVAVDVAVADTAVERSRKRMFSRVGTEPRLFFLEILTDYDSMRWFAFV